MKKLAYGMAAGLAAAMLMAGSASAAVPAAHASLDQYGCRWQQSTSDYRCYRGAMAGQRFASQAQMLEMNQPESPQAMRVEQRDERFVPIYVDDDGAPRPLPPQASRGKETPPIDSDMQEIRIW